MKISKILIKTILFTLWASAFAIALSVFLKMGIPISAAAERLQFVIRGAGNWGPVVYVGIYSLRSLIFFPASVLTVIGGLLFGPWVGLVLAFIGENISANISFMVGRYFSADILRHIVSRKKFVPRLAGKIQENGFLAVLIMRLSYLPFDLVGYSSGMCNIKHSAFALGTLIGTIPGLATFAFLGSSIVDPSYIALTVIFLVVGLAIAFFLKKYRPQQKIVSEH